MSTLLNLKFSLLNTIVHPVQGLRAVQSRRFLNEAVGKACKEGIGGVYYMGYITVGPSLEVVKTVAMGEASFRTFIPQRNSFREEAV